MLPSVLQVFNNVFLLPEGRKRFQRDDDMWAFLTGYYPDGTVYKGSVQMQVQQGLEDWAQLKRVTPTRLEVFQEMMACVLLLPVTFYGKALVKRFGTTDYYYLDRSPKIGAFTSRSHEKREAWSGDAVSQAGHAPLAKLWDKLRFSESDIPHVAGQVRGNSETGATSSEDWTAQYYWRGSHYQTCLRIIKKLGFAEARRYARFMLPKYARALTVWDGALVLDFTADDDTLNEQIRTLVCNKEVLVGGGAKRPRGRVLSEMTEHIHVGLLPRGWKFDASSKTFTKTGPDGEEVMATKLIPRITAGAGAKVVDKRAPTMGRRATKVLAKSTAAAAASATANGNGKGKGSRTSSKRKGKAIVLSPGAVKPAQLPRPPPVPVFAAVQSAKQPQRSVYAAIRAGCATNAAVEASLAVADDLNVPISPSPSVSLVLAAADLTSDPDSHYGDTFNSGTNLHMQAPTSDGVFPAVDKDKVRRSRTKKSKKTKSSKSPA